MGFGPFTNSRHWRKLSRAIAQPREIRQADRQTLLRAKARGLHQLHVIPLDLAGDSFRPLVRRHEDLDAELLRIAPARTRRHAGDTGHLQQLVPVSLRSEEHTSELQSLMRIPYAVFCL